MLLQGFGFGFGFGEQIKRAQSWGLAAAQRLKQKVKHTDTWCRKKTSEPVKGILNFPFTPWELLVPQTAGAAGATGGEQPGISAQGRKEGRKELRERPALLQPCGMEAGISWIRHIQ